MQDVADDLACGSSVDLSIDVAEVLEGGHLPLILQGVFEGEGDSEFNLGLRIVFLR